jgi:hypothetical protein
MQRLKIDCLKFNDAKTFTTKDGTEYVSFPLEANNVFTGKQGLYMEVTLMDNRDGPGKYGDDGFAILEIGKGRRDAGEKGPIIGNWKHVNTAPGRTVMPKTATAPPTPPKSGYEPDPNDETDDIPF